MRLSSFTLPFFLTFGIATVRAQDTIFDAIKAGNLNQVKQLVGKKGATPIKDPDTGLSPLALAIQENKIPIATYLTEHGADVNATDAQRATVLHKAVELGNLDLVKMLLKAGARKSVNAQDAMGKTPAVYLLQAARGSMIHLEGLETEPVKDKKTYLKQILPTALEEFTKKEAKKPSFDQVAALLQLLKDSGANMHATDKSGKTVARYIRNDQFIPETDRQKLFKIIGLPATPQKIGFSLKNLPMVLTLLEILASFLKPFTIIPSVQTVLWTIEAAQTEKDPQKQLITLRIALTLLAAMNGNLKSKVHSELSTNLAKVIDNIQLIIQDAALDALKRTEKK